MNIKHWEQYLTPLGKTRLNIKPDSFSSVLQWNHIILPIFQRKYCWTEKQLKRYWYDLLYISLDITDLGHRKHRRRHDNAHSLGKIITFEENSNNNSHSKITVIDGQQRLTTTIIMLVCIKKLLLIMQNESNTLIEYDLISKINSILFRKSVPDKYRNVNNIKYYEGDSLDFIRFLPTYLDRASFYDMIFDRHVKHNNSHGFYNSNLPAAKLFFDNELLKYKDYGKICKIYNKLLTQFKFVYVGIPKIEKQNACHCIYQWFFERELMIESHKNDRPGYSQSVTDLFRNYVLSFFINESMDGKQKQIYRLWISIEKSYGDISNNELNKYIVSLIDTKHLKPYHDVSGTGIISSYDIYRDLVRFIERKLNKYKEEEYKCFIEEFIRNLKRESNEIVIFGYLKRCVINDFDSTNSAMFNMSNIREVVEIVDMYLRLNRKKINSLNGMENDIDQKLKVIKF